jgi:hypothetical protein
MLALWEYFWNVGDWQPGFTGKPPQPIYFRIDQSDPTGYLISRNLEGDNRDG